MNQDNHDLWHIFEISALDLWRSGGPSPTRVGSRTEDVFAIKRLPAFANPVHWQLYRRIEESEGLARYVGVRREWNASADRQQFAAAEALVRYKYRGSIVPTLIDLTLDVNQEIVIPLLALIEAKSIPLLRPTAPIGCDGETTELTIGDYWAGVTLNWWSAGPDAWQSITELTEHTYSRLEELAAAHSG
jgi:hypothetical protein